MPTITPARVGPWALLTGGSSGIGFAHAEILAARGFNIAIVGRSTAKLASAASRLRERFRVEVDTLPVDLARRSAPAEVLAWVADRDVGVYVSSAGGVEPGDFAAAELDVLLGSVDLKVRATMTITHALAGRMRERRAGGILLVSSTGALQGIPLLATNAALEAYVLTFAESLHHELKRDGVTVTSLMPGPTTTEGFYAKAGPGATAPRSAMTPQATAKQGIAALDRGKVSHIAGAHNRLLLGLLTRPARTALMGRMIGRVFAAPNPT